MLGMTDSMREFIGTHVFKYKYKTHKTSKVGDVLGAAFPTNVY